MEVAEYIKRETLKEHLYGGKFQEGCAGCDEPGEGCIECIVDEIDNFPAADVAPVRRGYWKSKVNPQWKAYSHDECSICGWWNTRNAMCYDGNRKPGHSLNYCPNCGAKMEVDHDD